jgi:ligand-binding SRPBCC domain-containing protein
MARTEESLFVSRLLNKVLTPGAACLCFIVRLSMRRHFKTSQWVPCPPGLAFAFFANPLNLPSLMPEWQHARIEDIVVIAPPEHPAASTGAAPFHSIVAGADTAMLISFRPVPFVPIRMTWQAVISEFVWNDHFCDEQQRGPFAYWKHCHYVRDESRNGTPGTFVTDEVVYEMKMGALGEIAHGMVFGRQIRKLFHHRQRQLERLLPLPPRR